MPNLRHVQSPHHPLWRPEEPSENCWGTIRKNWNVSHNVSVCVFCFNCQLLDVFCSMNHCQFWNSSTLPKSPGDPGSTTGYRLHVSTRPVRISRNWHWIHQAFFQDEWMLGVQTLVEHASEPHKISYKSGSVTPRPTYVTLTHHAIVASSGFISPLSKVPWKRLAPDPRQINLSPVSFGDILTLLWVSIQQFLEVLATKVLAGNRIELAALKCWVEP